MECYFLFHQDFKKGAGESNKLVPGGRIAGEGSGRFLVVEVGGPEIWEAKQNQTHYKGSLVSVLGRLMKDTCKENRGVTLSIKCPHLQNVCEGQLRKR